MNIRYKLFYTILLIIFNISLAKALVLKGNDTLAPWPESKIGYDFVNQMACTSYTDYTGCHNHIYLLPGATSSGWKYNLAAPSGYGVNMGLINLDSLKTAPADSIFSKHPTPFDQIPVDSLASRVGCSYWIKTGPDPQDGNSKLFVKIRILSLKVLDSANHKVSMRFIYACDAAGNRACATSNFDTFDPNSGTISPRGSRASVVRSVPGTYRVIGDRFVIPKEFQGRAGMVEVYSLAGRRLGAVKVEKSDRDVDMRRVRGGEGVVVVKMKSEG